MVPAATGHASHAPEVAQGPVTAFHRVPCGSPDEPAPFGGLFGDLSEHDHATAQYKLGVGDGAVRVRVDRLSGKTKYAAKPVYGFGCIAVTQSGNEA